MSAPFEFVDHERERGVALYYEDDQIAVNTWMRCEGTTTYHEVFLNPPAVQLLIEALTTMQADINIRFPKGTQS
ncbi:hypothetical protein [Arthrobacter luteolus]|uniref:hypothetical protein n=1 Tax=Arthrobacter luteolus TaxID=98672 RepID=UPI00082F3AD9|nr:hypothetical protein [Arthrobacter luteolus]